MSLPGPYAIEVRNVSKRFSASKAEKFRLRSAFLNPADMVRRPKSGDEWALRDISFSVFKGEFFGILGRNGSGKSTLLKMLAGIYKPNEGTIRIAGAIMPFIELGVGFNAELSGIDNIFLNGAMLGLSKSETQDRLHEIISFSELEDSMHVPLKNYSSGMQVRLAFAIATVIDTPIFLVDEVLAVGDTAFQHKCFAFFRDLKRRKKTVIFVTHDMAAVRQYCDRAILINEHRIVAEGSAEKIAEKYDELFPESSQEKVNAASESAYLGNRDATFTTINTTILHKSETGEGQIEIHLVLTFSNNIAAVNAGFLIENEFGTKILGTNSEIKGKRLRNLKAGQKLDIIWRFANILNPGKYAVTVAATSLDGSVVYDWQDRACAFEIVGSDGTPYPVNPPIDFVVTEL